MAMIAPLTDAGPIIESWAIDVLTREWTALHDVTVLVQASMTAPVAGQPLTARILLLALRAEELPLHITVQADVVTQAAVVEAARTGMAAIRHAIIQSNAVQATADDTERDQLVGS